MRSAIKGAMAACLFTLIQPGSVPAQSDQCADDAILVFDGSGSMAEMGYNGLDLPRIFDARQALRRSLPDVTPFRRVGLMVYGPGPGDICSNVSLRLPPRPDAADSILAEIDRLTPSGNTPLTRAVSEAADVLLDMSEYGVVVLVTDGKETCGGQTCQLAATLAAERKITVHVIGFRVRGEFFNWQGNDDPGFENGRTPARCLADRTGGKYVSTETTEDLVQALQDTLACPLLGRIPEYPREYG